MICVSSTSIRKSTFHTSNSGFFSPVYWQNDVTWDGEMFEQIWCMKGRECRPVREGVWMKRGRSEQTLLSLSLAERWGFRGTTSSFVILAYYVTNFTQFTHFFILWFLILKKYFQFPTQNSIRCRFLEISAKRKWVLQVFAESYPNAYPSLKKTWNYFLLSFSGRFVHAWDEQADEESEQEKNWQDVDETGHKLDDGTVMFSVFSRSSVRSRLGSVFVIRVIGGRSTERVRGMTITRSESSSEDTFIYYLN